MKTCPELPIPDEVKQAAVDYVDKTYRGPFQRDSGFNGKRLERIMGHVGELMAKRYFDFTEQQMGSMSGSLQADRHDFRLYAYTFDVKTSYSSVYKEYRRPPADWGLLIPNSQFNFRRHDYYIRCLVDSMSPEFMTSCLFLCACERVDVKRAPVKMWRMDRRDESTLMRVVPASMCFEVEKLKERIERIREGGDRT